MKTRQPNFEISHFSTSDVRGGAAQAAWRLHRALLDRGASSTLYVRERSMALDHVVQAAPRVENPLVSRLGRVWRRADPTPTYTFNLDQSLRIDLAELKRRVSREGVMVLHWVDRFLNVGAIAELAAHAGGPLVWVIHDLEPLTGGCHYSFGCDGYQRECGACPQLRSTVRGDLSHRIWRRKQQALSTRPICFVAPTSWGEARVRESSLFRNHRVARIPLPIDGDLYRPYPRQVAREVLHLPPDRRLLLCGASYLEDRRKGIPELISALRRLDERERAGLLLLVVGLNGQLVLRDLPIESRYLGEVADPLLMALVYQAADLFLCPSLADSGPMMIPEAMLCGTPVVAFEMGGAPDLIEHGVNGYLARLGDVGDLAAGIRLVLAADRVAMGTAARQRAEIHRPDLVARQHLKLYAELMEGYAANNQS